MKNKMLMMATIGLAALGATGAELRAADASHSVWDGVYTADQANRGKTQFTDQCASCHGDTLAGSDMVPALSGKSFLYNWNGLSVADLVDRIQTSMPQDNPGSLDHKTVVDIVTYILSANQFPAGNTELPTDAQALHDIQILNTKPGN